MSYAALVHCATEADVLKMVGAQVVVKYEKEESKG
jgi:hypothetical protein